MDLSFPYKIIDLTHTLDDETPTWDLSCGFKAEVLADYSDFESELKFRVHQLHIRAGIGTHMDSPSHCFSGSKTIDQLDLNDLISPAVCLNVSDVADEKYTLTLEDVEAFEAKEGQIPQNAFILVYTGWDKHWDDRKKFHNDLQFPAVSIEACKYFVERNCVGLGVDTLSPDRPESGYPVHSLLLGSGRYIVENAACLGKLPAKGFYSLALPIKAKGCTECPIRLIALIPDGTSDCPHC